MIEVFSFFPFVAFVISIFPAHESICERAENYCRLANGKEIKEKYRDFSDADYIPYTKVNCSVNITAFHPDTFIHKFCYIRI